MWFPKLQFGSVVNLEAFIKLKHFIKNIFFFWRSALFLTFSLEHSGFTHNNNIHNLTYPKLTKLHRWSCPKKSKLAGLCSIYHIGGNGVFSCQLSSLTMSCKLEGVVNPRSVNFTSFAICARLCFGWNRDACICQN